MALPAMNPILQQFAHRQTALQHVEHAPFQQENPLALLVAALGGGLGLHAGGYARHPVDPPFSGELPPGLQGHHHRPVDAGIHHPPVPGPRHHPPLGAPVGNPHHGELSLDLSPQHQEIGPGGGLPFTEPQQPGFPPVPFGASGINYMPPIRRRPELMQALSNVAGGGSAVHPVGMV